MKFWKENSYDIVRLCVNQLGIAVFALMLYFSTGLVSDSGTYTMLYTLVSVFSIGFYFVLLYFATWDMGAKDKIRADSGKAEHTPYKGIFLGLFANLLNIILILLSILGKSISMAGGGDFFGGLFAFGNLVLRFIASMYLGVLNRIFAFLKDASDLYLLFQCFGFLFFVILCCAVCALGYFNGQRDFRIFSSSAKKKN